MGLIQALKACKDTQLWDKGAFRTVSSKALKFLDQVQGSNGAIGYRGNPAQNPGLTGGGVLAFQMWDKGTSRNARAGVKYISQNTAFNWADKSSNLYYRFLPATGAGTKLCGVCFWREDHELTCPCEATTQLISGRA